MSLLRIATRRSPLALWQSEHVADLLRAAHLGLDVILVPMSTRGDEVLDRSLSAIGGKGLFLKELEMAILRGDADCAVHSLKDVPMQLDAPFALCAILPRADYADAFISNHYDSIDALPHQARVGTSSLRRQAQLKALRPDLTLLDLRGNVNTRLNKLDANDYDAIILACAGLQRLGSEQRIRGRLDAPYWLPAPGQGAIVIECHENNAEVQNFCAVLEHAESRVCAEAERAMNRVLGGSCHLPVAALAQMHGEGLRLQGLVGSAIDGGLARAEGSAHRNAPEALGQEVAEKLLSQGARALIDSHALK